MDCTLHPRPEGRGFTARLINHDLLHLSSYIIDLLNLRLLEILASDLEDKQTRIQNYMLRHAEELGERWDKIREFLKDDIILSHQKTHLSDFKNELHMSYHERQQPRGSVTLKLIAISPPAIKCFLREFIRDYGGIKDSPINNKDIEEIIGRMESFFSLKKLEIH